MDQSTLFAEEHPVSPSQSQDSEAAWRTIVETWPSNSVDLLYEHGPVGWSGRTCPASYQAGQMIRTVRRKKQAGSKQSSKETILTASSKGWQNAGISEPGGLLTLSLPEFNHTLLPSPNGDVVCSLSDILETGDHLQRYCLSAKACAGILRRAEKRGKTLPKALRAALQAVADSEPTSNVTED